jgi:hypothetical protein
MMLQFGKKSTQQYVPNTFVSGQFDGTISDFTIKNLVITANQFTEIRGEASIKGIPDFDKMYIDAQIQKLQTKSTEIKKNCSLYKITQGIRHGWKYLCQRKFQRIYQRF